MNFAQALKNVHGTAAKSSYYIIHLCYDSTLVLNYKDGTAFISALVNAEKLTDSYQTQQSIGPMTTGEIKITLMSQEEYENYKLAAMLCLNLGEVAEMRKNQHKATV